MRTVHFICISISYAFHKREIGLAWFDSFMDSEIRTSLLSHSPCDDCLLSMYIAHIVALKTVHGKIARPYLRYCAVAFCYDIRLDSGCFVYVAKVFIL